MFVWRYLDGDGGILGASGRFADQDSAEEWMGESWADLRERGVEQVVLVDEHRDRALYRMGLGEE